MKKYLIILFALVFLIAPKVFADDPCASLSNPSERVDCYTKRVAETQGREKTLSSQLDVINGQISSTQLKMSETQAKLDRLTDGIASVSGKIDLIEDSLDHTSKVIVNRIVTAYMSGRVDPVIYLLSSNDFLDLTRKADYLRQAQIHDQELIVQMATTRKNYSDQRNVLEDRKKQVEVLSAQLKSQKALLDKQNREKQALLIVTRNDEARYQQLLSDAQREADALRTSQFSGKKDVKKGDVIGLMGNTGYSFGAHLHFGVYNLAESSANNFDYISGANNPFDFLQNKSMVFKSASCDGIGLDTTKTIGEGSYQWPLEDAYISQCYGHTPWSWMYSNNFHEGVDMYSSNTAIHAVDDGVAYSYRGSGSLGNNIRIFHPNGKMSLYLHLQ